MENKKQQKRLSLKLSSIIHKRHSSSPQSRACASSNTNTNIALEDTQDAPPDSPTIVDLTVVPNTPPHRKSMSLDDSIDFSPRLDRSLSPSSLFSQTLVTESPEIGWRWTHHSNNNNQRNFSKVNTTTDSGFDSAESAAGVKKLRDRYEERRSQQDHEQWRANQLRARKLLKERCDRLLIRKSPEKREPEKEQKKCEDSALADFLNDSDIDCFLLEATQAVETQLESTQISSKPQPIVKSAPVVTTPTSHHKNKSSSSLYMKFLEDEADNDDDWLASLDEAVLLDSQAKKPRLSLQRFNSMPTATGESSGSGSTDTLTTAVANAGSAATASTSSNTPKFKRHASSHAISPATCQVRGKLFGTRK